MPSSPQSTSSQTPADRTAVEGARSPDALSAETKKKRRIVLLTEGRTSPVDAKTATCVVRYCTDEVVALLDSQQRGKTSQELLGVGGDIPIIGSLSEAPGADTLLIGIAPSGGRIPDQWRAVAREAVERGMDIISGLHDYFSSDPAFVAAAEKHKVQLYDVRKSNERDCAQRVGIREECLRIQTVGQDCSVGKMVASVELARALQRAGVDAKFVATGQTGIMIEGDGCAVDGVVSDFLSGACEKLVLQNQHHDIMVIEGQGSLSHPKYSAVTLGLLHGCVPHGMILCYEAGRRFVHGMDNVPLTSLDTLRQLYESMAQLMGPAEVIGVAMNSRTLTPEEADAERDRVRDLLQLPVCDVFRHGCDDLVQAVLDLQKRRQA